jgi:hypothetical protein
MVLLEYALGVMEQAAQRVLLALGLKTVFCLFPALFLRVFPPPLPIS